MYFVKVLCQGDAMKTAVIEAGLAQMVAIGVGAGVGKLMGMALSPWGWPGLWSWRPS